MRISLTLAMLCALMLAGCSSSDEQEEQSGNIESGESHGGEGDAASEDAEADGDSPAADADTDATESTEADAAESSVAQAPVVGELAPDFTTTTQDGETFTLSAFRGKQPVALVFFPKDSTPSCTRQMCNLRDGQAQIDAAGVMVVGVSFESKDAHDAFREEHGLTTPILMDTERKIGELYQNTMEWNGMILPQRRTFVINKEGVLVAVIDQVKVDDHSAQIIAALEEN